MNVTTKLKIDLKEIEATKVLQESRAHRWFTQAFGRTFGGHNTGQQDITDQTLIPPN
jgi:hypothetical protein